MIYTVTLNPTLDRTMHFPRLVMGALNRATQVRTDLSGKGINVSVALRRFGVESVILSLRAGIYGRILFQGLREMGYTCHCVEVAGETRSNVTVIDMERGITTKLNEPGPTVAAEDIAAFEGQLRQHLEVGDLCVFSGSLPPGAPHDTYARLIAVAHERGAIAFLDTSSVALAAGCAARPDLIKPNAVEARELVGRPLERREQLVEGLAAMLELGPRRVLLTLGSRGAALADGATGKAPGMWLARPPEIRELSAVGAGDAALAGFLWAWGRGLDSAEGLRWAVAAGTATAMEDGTNIPSLERIQRVYEQVVVERLN